MICFSNRFHVIYFENIDPAQLVRMENNNSELVKVLEKTKLWSIHGNCTYTKCNDYLCLRCSIL